MDQLNGTKKALLKYIRDESARRGKVGYIDVLPAARSMGYEIGEISEALSALESEGLIRSGMKVDGAIMYPEYEPSGSRSVPKSPPVDPFRLTS